MNVVLFYEDSNLDSQGVGYYTNKEDIPKERKYLNISYEDTLYILEVYRDENEVVQFRRGDKLETTFTEISEFQKIQSAIDYLVYDILSVKNDIKDIKDYLGI